MPDGAYPKRLTLLFLAYSLCFVGGSLNHFSDILAGGFLPYKHVPFMFNAFWSSLACIDLFVPVLFILGKPRAAMIAAITIMVFDVVINTYYATNHLESIYRHNVDLLAQTGFLVFLVATVPYAWRLLAALAQPQS